MTVEVSLVFSSWYNMRCCTRHLRIIDASFHGSTPRLPRASPRNRVSGDYIPMANILLTVPSTTSYRSSSTVKSKAAAFSLVGCKEFALSTPLPTPLPSFVSGPHEGLPIALPLPPPTPRFQRTLSSRPSIPTPHGRYMLTSLLQSPPSHREAFP